jgi:hypothetical protein
MESYLLIGGNSDSMSIPARHGAESVKLPVGITCKEVYNRSTLTVGDVSTTVYIHENLTPEQALLGLIKYYKAWAVNRPGGR